LLKNQNYSFVYLPIATSSTSGPEYGKNLAKNRDFNLTIIANTKLIELMQAYEIATTALELGVYHSYLRVHPIMSVI
jgi:hypothetical protein